MDDNAWYSQLRVVPRQRANYSRPWVLWLQLYHGNHITMHIRNETDKYLFITYQAHQVVTDIAPVLGRLSHCKRLIVWSLL